MTCFTLSPLAASLLLLVPLGFASAQPGGSTPITAMSHRAPVLVGPVIGLNRNFHSGGFRTITGDVSCPFFEAGTGWGILGGLTAELLLDEGSALIPRVMYESRPGSFTSHLPDALVQMPGQTTPTTQTITASSDVTYGLLSAEVLYKQEITDLGSARIAVAAGPAAAYVVRGTNRQVQDLVDPPNARFIEQDGYELENAGRRLVFYDGDILEKRSVRVSLKAGLQAEVGLFGDTWYMTPGIYYDYGLSDVTLAENWQLNSVIFMVDFRRGF
jgi:hypothetical protein